MEKLWTLQKNNSNQEICTQTGSCASQPFNIYLKTGKDFQLSFCPGMESLYYKMALIFSVNVYIYFC